MIKGNKPYSNENGAVDDELLSTKTKEEQESVLAWIKKNLKVGDTFFQHSTSYGLKHLMHHDNGIYLTNNQFKDAMLISGFTYEDANALNWHFNIDRYSPLYLKGKKISFKTYIRVFYTTDDSSYGELVALFENNIFLKRMTRSSYKSYKTYLGCVKASNEQIKIFEELWCKYQNWLIENTR